MTDTSGVNLAEARTETGELKPALSTSTEKTTPATEKSSTEVKTEAKSADVKDVLGDKKTEAKAEAKPEAKPVVPDKYEFKAPESWAAHDWELDPKIIDRATPLFKELALSNEQAQKLVNFYAEESQKDHEATIAKVQEQSDEWLKELKADPDIGGKLDQVKATVGRLYDSLGDPKLVADFKEQMTITGIGNNPTFVRLFNKLAQKFTEGTAVRGKGPVEVRSPSGAAPSIASAMFPNLK